jgi:hypothetical protein
MQGWLKLKIPTEQVGYAAVCESCSRMDSDAPLGVSGGNSFRPS